MIAGMITPLVAFILMQAPGVRPQPRPGLSWQDADSLDQKLRRIEARASAHGAPADETVEISQRELNSYLGLTLAPQMPQGVSDVDVGLAPDRVEARATLVLDRLKGQISLKGGPFNPLSYLGGLVPLQVRGGLPNQDGLASVALEDVRLGGVSVPDALVGQLVAAATRSTANPQGFDIRAPFRLPYGIKRVRLAAGKATLEL